MKEIWKDIEGYEGLYRISNLGCVYSVKRDIYMSQRTDRRGYMIVNLCKHNEKKTFRIHRLVANAFLLNTHNKPEINHIDGNKKNNCIDYLEWVTAKENTQHAIKTGLISYSARR